MESWRKTWRDGLVPVLSSSCLLALRDALESDDPRLIQGHTVQPAFRSDGPEAPVEAADPLALMGWLGEGMGTVGEVEEFWSSMCFEIDRRIGEPAGCRWLLNWIDETPRDVMRRELLAEVNLVLAARGVAVLEVA